MESQTKLGKVVKEFEDRDVRIERVWVLYLIVPSLVDNFHNEVFARCVRRFVEGTVFAWPRPFLLPDKIPFSLHPC